MKKYHVRWYCQVGTNWSPELYHLRYLQMSVCIGYLIGMSDRGMQILSETVFYKPRCRLKVSFQWIRCFKIIHNVPETLPQTRNMWSMVSVWLQ